MESPMSVCGLGLKEEPGASCCKICFNESTKDSPLLSGVCGCKGSLDYVHGRCLVKWQIKRPSKPWHCEICDSRVQWPADDPLKLVELLAELTEKKPAPPAPPPAAPPTPIVRPRRYTPSKWKRLRQGMTRRCALAARSVSIVGKSMLEVARGRRSQVAAA